MRRDQRDDQDDFANLSPSLLPQRASLRESPGRPRRGAVLGGVLREPVPVELHLGVPPRAAALVSRVDDGRPGARRPLRAAAARRLRWNGRGLSVPRSHHRQAGGGQGALDLRPTSAARFEREATVLSSVGHPAIVGYVAHGAMPTGERYLVMEWLEGEDLAACLTHRRLTLAETLVLGARIGEALGALHALGIVHRDVKPGNIFLVGGDVAQVKLLDLGLARSGEMTNLTPGAGGLVGTLGYLAPEQARSEPSIDGRADVFSLGCVLFKCLTGTPAFAGEGMMALLANILFQEAPRPPRPLPRGPHRARRAHRPDAGQAAGPAPGRRIRGRRGAPGARRRAGPDSRGRRGRRDDRARSGERRHGHRAFDLRGPRRREQHSLQRRDTPAAPPHLAARRRPRLGGEEPCRRGSGARCTSRHGPC